MGIAASCKECWKRGNTVLKIPQIHIKKTVAGVGRHDKYVIFRVLNESKISEGHCLSVKLLI
jgi:hypothetical protein